MSGARPPGRYVQLQVPVPAGWVRLPLDADPAVWAEQNIREAASGVTAQETSVGAAAATQLLEIAVRRAQYLWDGDYAAPVSLALQPDPLGRVYAVLDACAFPLEDLPLSPERILGIGSDHGGILGEVEATEVELPAGPAIRYRSLLAAAPQDDEPTSSQVTEALAYVITPGDLPGFVLVEAQWADLDLADQIAEQVAAIAAGVVLEFRR